MPSDVAAPPLTLSLLGHFVALLPDGREAVIPTRKAQALLAYLALHPGQRFGRTHIASLLWGDSIESLARNSLRQTLFTIRRAFGSEATGALRCELDVISLNPDDMDVDVWQLQRRLNEGTREALEGAVELYRGDLLAGFYLNEPGFDDWITVQRERLRVRAFEAMATLLRLQNEASDYPQATRTAERLVALDPLDEAAHRALIRLHLRQGFRGAALRQYRACVDLLERELGVKPSPETSLLHEETLKGGGPELGDAPVIDPPGTAPTILIVEDDEAHRTVLERVLRQEGYVPTIAGDGGAALSELERQRFDLILADIRMPGIDGLQLLEAIRRRHGDVPTVLMTARRGDHWELKSLELGASDYIAKPFRTDVLLLRLKNLLRRPPGGTAPQPPHPQSPGRS